MLYYIADDSWKMTTLKIGRKSISFATPIAQIMGGQGPPLVEEEQIILLGIITTSIASIYS